MVEKARDLACAGVLGEGAVRLSVPSRASWEAQRAAALEAAQTEDDSLADGACESAGEAAEAAESVEPVEAIESVEAVEPADAVDDAAAIEGEPAAAEPEAAAPDEASKIVFAPAFEVDRTLWGVEYADGTVRTFDSAEGAFID